MHIYVFLWSTQAKHGKKIVPVAHLGEQSRWPTETTFHRNNENNIRGYQAVNPITNYTQGKNNTAMTK